MVAELDLRRMEILQAWPGLYQAYILVIIKVSGSSDGVQYSVTRRGAPSLVVDGYGYAIRKRRGVRVYWSCRSRGQGCTARALTVDGRLQAHARAARHTHRPPGEQHGRIESLIEIVPAVK